MEDLDSTQVLLDSTVATPDFVDSVMQDEEEEEIFFGTVTAKERKIMPKRRETICLSGSIGEWRKDNPKWTSRDSLLSTSSSRRSSLLSQENSITEEEDDDVFGLEEPMETNEDEVEVVAYSGLDQSQDAHEKILGWSTKGSSETLDNAQHHDRQPTEEGRPSMDGVYDSFSDDTAEESLAATTEEESEVDEDLLRIDQVKRRILQDSTILSSSNVSMSVEGLQDREENKELEIIAAQDNFANPKTTPVPKVIVTEATSPVQESNVDEDDLLEEEEIPGSPESEYITAPSSRRTTDSMRDLPSPTFDSTMEEMALYEMFGQDYDDIVATMSHEEKVELGLKISNRSEAEMKEVFEKLKRVMEADGRRSSVASSLGSDAKKPKLSIGSDISPFSLASSCTATPSPLSLTPVTGEPGDEEAREEVVQASPNIPPPSIRVNVSEADCQEEAESSIDLSINSLAAIPSYNPPNGSFFSHPQVSDGSDISLVEETPSPREDTPQPVFTSNFMLPTASSLHKRTPASPKASPRKVWMPPSPSPSKMSIGKFVSHNAKSPHSSNKKLAAISRLPQPIRTPQRQGQVLSEVKTPTSVNKKVTSLKSQYAAVASPVATYVKNNPAPNLVQNCKAKDVETPLESTLVEVEEKENTARLSLLPACPLPSAVYKTSSAMEREEETMEAEDQPGYEYVTEAYGAESCSAKVTRHVGRIKVPSNQGLTWSEDLFVNDESVNSSPSVAKFKEPGKSLLKMTRRDSGLFDESMMNVSVVETKVVKKVARGKAKSTTKSSRGRKK